jgi:adenylate kinase
MFVFIWVNCLSKKVSDPRRLRHDTYSQLINEHQKVASVRAMKASTNAYAVVNVTWLDHHCCTVTCRWGQPTYLRIIVPS